jgi:DNA-binding MarR family transcriptional regulator
MPVNDSSVPNLEPKDALAGVLDDRWRETHLGRLLGHAMRRFDARVLSLMANNDQVPLALSNLAARDQISAAHIHITRHLSLQGSRLTELAQAAGMSKQAMGNLVNQCEAWGLVKRASDSRDGRARQVVFTEAGLAWLAAFQMAVHRRKKSSRPLWATKLQRSSRLD